MEPHTPELEPTCHLVHVPLTCGGSHWRKELEAQSGCYSHCRGRGGWEFQDGGRCPHSQPSRGLETRPQVSAPSQDPGATFQPILAHLPAWGAKRQKPQEGFGVPVSIPGPGLAQGLTSCPAQAHDTGPEQEDSLLKMGEQDPRRSQSYTPSGRTLDHPPG